MKMYQVTTEFKEKVTEVLQAKKFSAVYPYMNLINREGFVYTQEELDSIAALLSEFSYSEVAEIFYSMKNNVSEIKEDAEVQEKD